MTSTNSCTWKRFSDKKDKMKFEFHVKWGLRGQVSSCLQLTTIRALQITSYATIEKNISIPQKGIKEDDKGKYKKWNLLCTR